MMSVLQNGESADRSALQIKTPLLAERRKGLPPKRLSCEASLQGSLLVMGSNAGIGQLQVS